MYQHPIGTLSPSGVLDVGLKCVHSCTFCYYSYFDGSDDQFGYMRRAPWKTEEELKSLLRNFKEWGLSRFDVTGGEPLLHPQIVELMRYAHQDLGLRARMTTLAQFLTRPMFGSSRNLIEDLTEAGLSEYLFSLHAVDADLFKKITGASIDKMFAAMNEANRLGLVTMTNTVVHRDNVEHLPEIARFVAKSTATLANFIVMKVEWGWGNKASSAVERKARYTDLLPFLKEAVQIIEAAGKPVNVRYGPYCAYRGLEKNLVGFKGVQMDPYEWRNGTRGGSDGGLTPYGKPPFLFFKTEEDYKKKHHLAVAQDPDYNMTQGEKCNRCAVRHICDGVDKDYIKAHGWDEFQPYEGPEIEDVVHFRKQNPKAFTMHG